jgi:DNA repair exonuclease SbcCD ATPase subunit
MENKKDLRDHLSGLQSYEPNIKVWDSIQLKLNQEDKFNKALKQLPRREPAELVWDEIKMSLKPRNPSYWKWALAASIILVGGFLILNPLRTKNQIEVSVQEVDSFKVLPKATNEDANFGEIMALCTQKVELCQDPEFEELKSEFEELKSASDQLRTVMGTYNTKNQLLEELQKIEAKKAELITALSRYI